MVIEPDSLRASALTGYKYYHKPVPNQSRRITTVHLTDPIDAYLDTSISINMCILSDNDIKRALDRGVLKIDGFQESCLTPNGYDLRIAEIMVGKERIQSGTVSIPPMKQAFISTLEYVELPVDLCAQLWLRTTWIRKGIMAGLGKVDAGFRGTLTFSIFNFSQAEVEIPVGERFVQIVFEKLHTPPHLPYEKRSGHYQGQRGITLNPVKSGDRRA